MNPADLRTFPLFGGLSDEALERIVEGATPLELAPGEVLVDEGALGDCVYLLLSGQVDVSKRSGERDLVIATRGPGEIIGELAVIQGGYRAATVRATQPTRALRISGALFEETLLPSPGVAPRLLKIALQRLRNMEQMLKQSEKMAALGVLAAGLAHELNNPAAAVKRGAAGLRESFDELQGLSARLAASQLTPAELDGLEALRSAAAGRNTAPVETDPLARSDLEDELGEWLDGQDVEDAWELAPELVGQGWTAAELEVAIEGFEPERRGLALRWLATAGSAYSLLDEINQGATRIGDIVKAVKSYSYLDQAPVQLVDVHEGLENTLIILRHKLKHGTEVHRQYEQGLPRIQAYASELNQVWTNILDNAIDAMDGHGEIWITTRADGDRVRVEIANNGPQIPPDALARVFDAFFTTKEPGKGTGLGLNITYNIVAKHHGDITVASDPDRTTFAVTLPVAFKS
jgi:signal transduction histidine kinase